MSCYLDDAKPLPKAMQDYCKLDPWEHSQWNFNRNSNILIEENAFENDAWKMAAILSQPQCDVSRKGIQTHCYATWKVRTSTPSAYELANIAQSHNVKASMLRHMRFMCIK